MFKIVVMENLRVFMEIMSLFVMNVLISVMYVKIGKFVMIVELDWFYHVKLQFCIYVIF